MIVLPVGGHIEEYLANAVRLDGSNDYITRGADNTGAADGKLGIVSFWIKWTGGDGSDMNIFTMDPSRIQITKEGGDNKFLVLGSDSGNTNRIRMTSNTAYTASSTWYHFCAYWDVGNAVDGLLINGSDDKVLVANSDANIDYTGTGHAMGGTPAGSKLLDAEIADFYFNQAEVLDLSVSANLLKFRSADGKPVDLGSDGSTPTGTAPIIFFSGDTATWHTNKGGGGGYTENGALTDAADSPSD
tara:strand:+ start:1687 stop:2418 length:732 start_codon:yes stop_codon:yes gene_type:complete